MEPSVPISELRVSSYTIPTDSPEADGTISWDSTTIVICELSAGATWGLGYSYCDKAAADLIQRVLKKHIVGQNALNIPHIITTLNREVRNIGRPGIAATAISAVDVALWDLKARLLGVSLVDLLGAVRTSIPVYGSGGFTSYTNERLQQQLSGWAEEGIRAVKMKVGTRPDQDLNRVKVARMAIGQDVALYVDANGAFHPKQALEFAHRFSDMGVSWFEEPVSSDDLAGLALIRSQGPAGMDIAAGEYGYDAIYFNRMLHAGAVDVLQADATRCGGITGFMQAAALCEG